MPAASVTIAADISRYADYDDPVDRGAINLSDIMAAVSAIHDRYVPAIAAAASVTTAANTSRPVDYDNPVERGAINLTAIMAALTAMHRDWHERLKSIQAASAPPATATTVPTDVAMPVAAAATTPPDAPASPRPTLLGIAAATITAAAAAASTVAAPVHVAAATARFERWMREINDPSFKRKMREINNAYVVVADNNR